ncbi:MAG: TonB-dependent receptor [Bryobacteraceae bacterium]
MSAFRFTTLVLALSAGAMAVSAQTTGVVSGAVVLRSTGQPLHDADVLVPRLGRKAKTDPLGKFEFRDLPPGSYDILAHMHGLSDSRQRVEVTGGGTAEAKFELDLSAVREQITVSASGRAETTLETFVSATSQSQIDLAAKSGSTSLGDLLDDQPGISKRSFGPGTTRPVVRGFDGDRVLVLEDGVRTGTLSSQSGDHGEPIDPNQVERLEVVRGPATLLYGSNAIGGVINAVSPEHELHEKPHAGWSGSVSATAGSNNGQAGTGAALRYGAGNWTVFGGGSGMRSGDYHTALGEVPNSASYLTNGRIGVGRFSERGSFALSYSRQDGRYGVPFAYQIQNGGAAGAGPETDLAFRRNQARFTGSVRGLGAWFEQFTVKLGYTDWNHKELEDNEVGTQFFNKQFVYRGEIEQKRKGPLSGSFGFQGMRRDFKSEGEEALSPPVGQNSIAVFGLEQLDFEKIRFQFGARMEHNSYDPERLKARSFNGVSASAGVNVPLWKGGAFVTNFTHSYRAPALEELYYNGPHVGNVSFEVGSDALRAERSNGVDVSLRQQSQRFRGEVNFFYYRMADFVYLAPTGQVRDGLQEALYSQAASRFVGSEAKASVGMSDNVWVNLSFDQVSAQLVAGGRALPRIPPVRGRVGLDLRHKGWSVRPELQIANHQTRVFTNERPTAGYVVPNLAASYTVARQHALHVFTVNVFNIGDRIYRNHLSFIREFAPEMGRGVRFGYNLSFY